jgi:hypothetical protein
MAIARGRAGGVRIRRGGAAVIKRAGRAEPAGKSPRPDDLYVHVIDQKTLNAYIDRLLVAGVPAT